MKMIAPLLLALFVFLPMQAQDALPTNLRPQWAVGQNTTYQFWGKTQKSETAKVLGQERSETTTFITEGKVTWRVDAVNADGSATCTMQLKNLLFTIKAGENEPIILPELLTPGIVLEALNRG